MDWRLIETDPLNAYQNMALDEALLLAAVEESDPVPVLRLYRWEKPSVTIGYHQDASRELNLDACALSDIPIVRRPTGGRAVYHHSELTFSLVISRKELGSNGVIESYRKISRAFINAFSQLDIKAETATFHRKKSGGNGSAACFISPSWYEITVEGKKIVGNALKRIKSHILFQGSVLIDFDASLTLKYIGPENQRSARNRLKNGVTAVNLETSSPRNYREVRNAFVEGFKKGLKITMISDQLRQTELKKKDRLFADKYSRLNWNINKQ
ncbi:MAG: biotin/lipoate A/B protein ligase family protein [bacterium]